MVHAGNSGMLAIDILKPVTALAKLLRKSGLKIDTRALRVLSKIREIGLMQAH